MSTLTTKQRTFRPLKRHHLTAMQCEATPMGVLVTLCYQDSTQINMLVDKRRSDPVQTYVTSSGDMTKRKELR